MGPSAPSGPQLGDLPTAHLAEFRQQCDEREREDRTDARHGSQEPIALSQGDIGGDHRGEPLVEQCDIQRKAHETAAIQTPQDRVLEQSGCILGRDFLVAELPSRGHDLGHPLGGLVTLSRAGWHGGDEQRNHSGNELAKLKWVDLSDGYARREQGTEDAALVATTRLNANGRAPVGANLLAWWTDTSPGLAPFKTWSTWLARRSAARDRARRPPDRPPL